MIKRFLFSILLSVSTGATIAGADVLYLTNGEQVGGRFVEETMYDVMIETPESGRQRIDKQFIERRVKGNEVAQAAPKAKKESRDEIIRKTADLWQRKISLGYSQSGGNTEKSQGNLELDLQRKTDTDEFDLRVSSYVATEDDKLDARKFYGLARYGYGYGDSRQWYRFHKVEGDQDRFANIDYRVVPSTGFGYRISDTEDFKAMLEGAVGFQHTNYRGSTKSENEAVLVPRGYWEARLFGDLAFSQDLTLYPSLEDTGEYRLRAESVLTNPMTQRSAWKVSFIDDYNSDPVADTKKNDYRLLSSVDISF